jgi:hypothetical protein
MNSIINDTKRQQFTGQYNEQYNKRHETTVVHRTIQWTCCELLSFRVFYYTVHCIVLWTAVVSCVLLYCSLNCPVNCCRFVSFIMLFIVLSCELLSFRVFYYTVHCVGLWTAVVSYLLLYCSLHCPVNWRQQFTGQCNEQYNKRYETTAVHRPTQWTV